LLIEDYGICELEPKKDIISPDSAGVGITREQFMAFFRSDDFHDKITPDDADEIFRQVMHGSCDFSVQLFNEVLRDYDAGFIVIKDTSEDEVIPKASISSNKIVGWASSIKTFCPQCVKEQLGTPEGDEEYFDNGEQLEPITDTYKASVPMYCEACGDQINCVVDEPAIETADPTRLAFMRENGVGQCAECKIGLTRWSYLTKLADKSKTGEEQIYCEKCINKAVRSK
jgi:hypothetical protein